MRPKQTKGNNNNNNKKKNLREKQMLVVTTPIHTLIDLSQRHISGVGHRSRSGAFFFVLSSPRK